MKKAIIIIVIIIVLISAISYYEYHKLSNSPVLVNDFKLKIKDNSISGNCAFDLENQSKLSFDITAYNLALFINNVQVTQIAPDKTISFKAGEKTTINIPYDVNLKTFKGFDLINFMTKLINDSTVDITIKGKLNLNKGFINTTIPVNYTVKDFKKN